MSFAVAAVATTAVAQSPVYGPGASGIPNLPSGEGNRVTGSGSTVFNNVPIVAPAPEPIPTPPPLPLSSEPAVGVPANPSASDIVGTARLPQPLSGTPLTTPGESGFQLGSQRYVIYSRPMQ